MANMPQTKNDEELKSMTVGNLKKAYLSLADTYNKILDNKLIHCCKCNEHLSADTFYMDNNYASGKFPICKRCILEMVEQRNKKSDEPNETKESVQKVLHMMDLPYDNEFYMSCIKGAEDGMKEKNRKSPFSTYITCMKSLPNWKGKTWADSDFGYEYNSESEEQIKLNQKTLKNAKKRFGSSYSNEDLMFLEDEYQDWISRYECNQKAQEEVFENLSIIKLLKNKALKDGKPTKDLDKQQQDWLDTGNLKPKQNTLDTFSDAQTMGTLLQKFEETRPLPEIDEELSDVDKIGLYIDTFYRGHACKMLGLKNTFSNLYEKVMAKYTVKPPEYDDETDSEVLFDKIFGSVDDE